MQWNPAIWIEDARQFLGEVRSEFKKVTFPTQKETVAGTIGVLVIVVIITAVLGLFDFGLGQIMKLIVE
jgi:preprotein translocase subunit SecE